MDDKSDIDNKSANLAVPVDDENVSAQPSKRAKGDEESQADADMNDEQDEDSDDAAKSSNQGGNEKTNQSSP